MASISTVPAFFPDRVELVKSRSALDFIGRYQRSPIYVPAVERVVNTAHIEPSNSKTPSPPVCFLHGFDSSSLDFRKIVPIVEQSHETWAVDLVGWGFSDSSLYVEDPGLPCGPNVKSSHLYEFWKEKINRPMVLMGVSLGGAVAIDFALKHPEAVDSLVLSSSQGYIDGLGMLSKLPEFLTRIGVGILQTELLREAANKIAYYTKEVDIKDAMVIGRLHTFLPGWTEASLAFIRSGGYTLSKKIPSVQCPTLIIWGRQDEVLGTEFAPRFQKDIKGAHLVWIEECGHAGHIEKAAEISKHLLEFLDRRS